MTHDIPPIDSFTGGFRFLSNFYPAAVCFEGWNYRTVEHAYQAAKTLDEEERKKIREAPTPNQAKKLGQRVTLRAGWEVIKENVMRDLLEKKFDIADLRQQLRDTGRADLIEGNTWGDVYWGICKGKGKNRLGHLLMKVREKLRVATMVFSIPEALDYALANEAKQRNISKEALMVEFIKMGLGL